MVANVETMMYAGAVPWHGKGLRLENLATSAEAIVAAGLDWTVSKTPVNFVKDDVAFASDKWSCIVRNDNNAILGVVKRMYNPLQNKDAFSWFDAVVGIKEAMYETAGALGNGQKIWILAKLPGFLRIGGDDTIEKYVLLYHAHDGTISVSMCETGIRVVCQNTLNQAIRRAKANDKLVKVRHTRSMSLRLDDVRKELNISNARFALMEEMSKSLVGVQMTPATLGNYIAKTMIPFEYNEAIKNKRKLVIGTRTQNMLDEIVTLFEGKGRGSDLPTAKGTAWGAFNAITEFIDFGRGTKNTKDGNADNNRTESILFGSGLSVKQRAWDNAIELVGK